MKEEPHVQCNRANSDSIGASGGNTDYSHARSGLVCESGDSTVSLVDGLKGNISQDATKDLIESMRYNKAAFDAARSEISRLKKELREKQRELHRVHDIALFVECGESECIRIREMTEPEKESKHGD